MSNEIKDWVMVPREPDGDMLDAAIDAHIGFDGEDEVDAVWATMLKAAPTPPAEAQVVGGGFEEWFGAVWAGSDNIPVPEWRSEGWGRYVAQRQLALGAWEAALSAQPPQDTFTERHAELLKSVRVGETLTKEQWESVCAYVIEGDEVIDKQNERLADLASAPVGVELLEFADRIEKGEPYARNSTISRWCQDIARDMREAAALAQQPAALRSIYDLLNVNTESDAGAEIARLHIVEAKSKQPAAVDGAMLRKLRDYFEGINNDEDGDDYRNLSADAMDLIDSALAQPQGEG